MANPVYACESRRHSMHKSSRAAARCASLARRERLANLKPVPADFPVKVLTEEGAREARKNGGDVCMCLDCERSWDDSISTTWTPVPAGRCPFEYYH